MARLVLVEDDEPAKPKLVEVNADMGAQESNAAYTRGRNLHGGWQGLASVMQGPTFGFADEIGGAVGGAYKTLTQPYLTLSDLALGKKKATFGVNYRETRDMLRGAADAQEEQNPWTTGITRSMASAPMMLFGGGAGAARPVTMAAQAGRAGVIGAGTGALQGAGGSTADTLGGLALDTAAGGAFGFGLSAAGVPLSRGMGKIIEQGLSRLSGSKAAQYAREKVAEAVLRDARGAAVQANPDAPFQQVLARYSKMGPEARVADAGGQNTRQLLDTLATLPGRTKDAQEAAIRLRQTGRADRLIGAATKGLQTGGDRAASVVDDLVAMRETASRPLYGKLHKMQVDADQNLAELVSSAEKLGASKIAKDIATANRVPYTLTNESQGRWDMRDLDYLKQGLDELIEKATSPDGKLSPRGFAMKKLRTDLLNALDDQTGGFYKQARDAYSGPSALISASNKGRMFLSADDASTGKVLGGFSESEKEAFRVGAFEALRNKLGKPGGQTEVMGMWKDKILGEKLRAIFPGERDFREFSATVAKEARMKGLESVGRGSQTAARLAGSADLDVPAAVDAVQLLSGSGGVPGVMSGASRLWGKVQTPEPVRDAMGGLLLSQGQAGRAGIIDLEEALRRVNRNRQLEAMGLGLLGGMGGAGASGLLVP
jgi:hypothetical protein